MSTRSEHHEVLGVGIDASDEEIKAAYRRLAKKYHPDNQKTGDEEKFKQITQSYQILQKEDPDNLFEKYTSQYWEKVAEDAAKRARQRRKRNITVNLSVDMKKMVRGEPVRLNINRKIECKICGGAGYESRSKCSTCGGTGVVIGQSKSPRAGTRCSVCDGRGFQHYECDTCDSRGFSIEEEIITINIPKGSENGRKLIMRGRGHELGSRVGDLIIILIEKSKGKFKRVGSNIHREHLVNFSKFITGGVVETETIYGEKVRFEIKPGMKPGSAVSIEGKGAYDRNTEQTGNMIVVLQPYVPKKSEVNPSLLDKMIKSEDLEPDYDETQD